MSLYYIILYSLIFYRLSGGGGIDFLKQQEYSESEDYVMQGHFGTLYQYQFTDPKEMSKDELIEELVKFRNLWTWVSEDVRYWLTHTRYSLRVVRRDYHAFKGLLGTVHFELKSIDIDVEDEDFNYLKGTKTIEWKTVTVPINQLVDFEWIHEEEVRPMEGKEEDEEELEQEGELSLDKGG